MAITNTLASYRLQLIKLTTKDLLRLNNYLRFIEVFNSEPKHKIAGYLKDLEKYSPRDIYIFSENNTAFKNFILRPDCPLTASWRSFLKNQGYLGEPLISLDRSIHVTILDQFVGAYLFSDYLDKLSRGDNEAALRSLDLACNYSLFEALITRCALGQEKIKKTKDDKERVVLMGQVVADTKILSKLYGSVGYMHTALVLLDLGNFYSNLQVKSFTSVARVFYKTVAENFLAAKELLGYPFAENEKVIKAVCKADFLSTYGFSDWESAENYFLGPFSLELTSLNEIRLSVKKMVEQLLRLNRGLKTG